MIKKNWSSVWIFKDWIFRFSTGQNLPLFLKLAKICLALFFIIFPFQIRTLIYSGTLYTGGNFNPYTSFFLYASDIFLFFSCVLWGLSLWKGESRQKQTWSFGYEGLTFLLAVFLLMVIGSTFIADNKTLNLLLSFRFLEFFLLYMLVVNEVLTREEVLRFFMAGMFLQAGMAIFQYIRQESLGLRFLGEPILSTDTPGVAKIDVSGGKLLRSYGTFPHPNVLAGALVTALFFCFYQFRKKYRLLFPLGLFFIFALLLTFSRSAFFGTMAAVLIYFSISEKRVSFKYFLLFVSFLLFFSVVLNLDAVFIQRVLFQDDANSVIERAEYFGISKNMLLNNPWGVGLGNFTVSMQDYTQLKLAPWLLQPVHNVFLLVLNELGVAAGVLFLFLIIYLYRYLVRALKFLKDNESEKQFCMVLLGLLTAIIVVSLFDHYFFTLYPGQILLFLYLALASAFLAKNEGKTNGILKS